MFRIFIPLIFWLSGFGAFASESEPFHIGPFLIECGIFEDEALDAATTLGIQREGYAYFPSSSANKFRVAEQVCPKSVFTINRGTALRDRYISFVEHHDIPGGWGHNAIFCHEHRDDLMELTYDCVHLKELAVVLGHSIVLKK